THTIRMDWLLPGVAPTGRRVELPFVVIVQFEGDKLAHEHLYWDQASVLVQVGLLDRTLPVRGGETAAQVLNPTQPMNELIRRAATNSGFAGGPPPAGRPAARERSPQVARDQPGSGRPQETPNRPQVPPRNGRATPLPFLMSRVSGVSTSVTADR